jgi:hypothetical protein
MSTNNSISSNCNNINSNSNSSLLINNKIKYMSGNKSMNNLATVMDNGNG